MSRTASLELCKKLSEWIGWDTGEYRWLCLPLTITKGSSPELDYSNWQVKHISYRGRHAVTYYPAFTLDYLVEKAFELGLFHVKIKQAPGGYIITAPPVYHIEASTPANGVAKLLIRALNHKAVA